MDSYHHLYTHAFVCYLLHHFVVVIGGLVVVIGGLVVVRGGSCGFDGLHCAENQSMSVIN